MMKKLLLLLLSLPLLGLACTDDEPPLPPRPLVMDMGHGDKDICPMYVMNAEVIHHDVEGGCEMRFAASPGGLADLRGRVRGMAVFYREHRVKGPADEPMPPVTVAVEDTPGGASILFRAEDAGDVDTLRAHVLHHAARLAAGRCQVSVMGCAQEQPMDPKAVAQCSGE
jgi:hypothetical protein